MDPPAPAPAPAAPPRRPRLILWFLTPLVILGGAGALFTWVTLSYSYSRGERVGYLQKFSQRGWVCKTWEGELAMATMPGVVPEKFYFSTRNEAVAAQVNSAIGKRVRIRYAQHKFVPTSCFGETEFFVAEAQPAAE
jgi:hypothetical protein